DLLQIWRSRSNLACLDVDPEQPIEIHRRTRKEDRAMSEVYIVRGMSPCADMQAPREDSCAAEFAGFCTDRQFCNVVPVLPQFPTVAVQGPLDKLRQRPRGLFRGLKNRHAGQTT